MTEHPNPTANPFVIGQPVSPERFVGRKFEIDTAFDQIHNRGNLAIWGGPGMGKSSFLDKLASSEVWIEHGQDPNQAVIVRLNCESINPFIISAFWRQVLQLLQQQLQNLGTESALQKEINLLLKTEPTTRESLQLALQKLGEQNKFLLLLVDNYHQALHPNEQYTEAQMDAFLMDCRYLAIAATEKTYISMIVTSLQRLSELGPSLDPRRSPWFNHYLFQPLKLFSKREVDQLLTLNIPKITPALREAIREITGGHPYLLQIAGSLVYRKLRGAEALDIKTFVEQFESSTRQIFQSIWQRCSEVEQTLLMLMALSGLNGRLQKRLRFDLSGIDLIFTQRERELTNLKEQGVIIRTENYDSKQGTREYSFTSSIMERWVIQEIWNTGDPTLKGREKVFLKLMSHQQVQKVRTAMDWLWKNKNQVPSILVWFEKVVGAI